MRFIKSEYEEMFSCRVGMFATGGPMSIFVSETKAYDISDYSRPWEEFWKEIQDLMEESIKTGRNVLLEKYKDREYEVEPLNLDYDY